MAQYQMTVKITVTSKGEVGAKFSNIKCPNLHEPDKLTDGEKLLLAVGSAVVERIELLGEKANEKAGDSSD